MIGGRAPFVLPVAVAFLAAGALPGVGQEQPAVVGLCVADLAERLGLDRTDVAVVSVEETTWPDGSLGHPEPGKLYTPAEAPGYRVVLAAADQQHEYHTSRARLFVYCGPVGEPAPVPPPDTGSRRGPDETAVAGDDGAPEAAGDGAGTSYVFYLREMPNDPNGNGMLIARRVSDRADTVWLDRVTAYAVSPTGAVLAVRRTSRSTHDLLLKPPNAPPRVLAGGFAFRGPSWQGATPNFSFWFRDRIDASWRLCLGDTSGTIRKLSVEVAVPVKPTAVQWGPDSGTFTVPVSDTSETIYVIEAGTGSLLSPVFQGYDASLVHVAPAAAAGQAPGGPPRPGP